MAHWKIVLNGIHSKAFCSECDYETPGATPEFCPNCRSHNWEGSLEDITQEYLTERGHEGESAKKRA